TITTEKPRNALYIFDREIIPTIKPIVIGKLTIEVSIRSDVSIAKVEFYVDGALKFIDTTEPYSWTWKEFAIGMHEIKVIAYDAFGRTAEATATVFKIF
ncbi:MAG: Ig-like domain-containing protein, partial [Candidatus Thermoplasmatota archaeon]